MNEIIFTGLCFFFIAVLYSTVGHAGASGYLATMALLSFPPDVMKPTALALNILVALVTSIRFYTAGHFSWRLFWPFAVTSIPLAYLGGGLTVASGIYKSLVGIALLFAAAHLLMRYRESGSDNNIRLPGIIISALVGGFIGFVSGLTGVGGGIFLSPVLVIAGWAELRQTSSIAAVFILVNSVSGLAGHLQKGGTLPDNFPIWGVVVLAGGFIGASLGATRINNPVLRVLLGIVLILAGIKMAVT
ncbi:MAG: sulfite exporter TauE/SafE family protein [Nitrospirota bacterium]